MQKPNAYDGMLPFIFVSYAHLDSDAALPIISALEDRGFRVWYDGGIEAGTEWPEYIASHLNGCEAVLALVSNHSLDSHNCRREINFAIELKKPMLVVYLQEVELSLGMRMQLGTLQAMFRNRHSTMDSFMESLGQCSILQPCCAAASHQVQPISEESEFLSKPPVKYERRTQQDFEDGQAKARKGDFAGALEDYRLAADKCHVQAQYELGMAYYDGYGTKADLEQAITWFEMAAMQGYSEAQYMLGRIYERQRCDHGNAAFWFQKAADQGHNGAIKELAHLYKAGFGVEEDPAMMVRLYHRAAQASDPEAQAALGRCYLHGEGVEQNAKEAVKWFQQAAMAGESSAQVFLGECLEQGVGIEKDPKEATQWYRRSAVQGNTFACYRLGRCYEFGIGVAQDEKEAGKWFAEVDRSILEIIETELTWDELDMASTQTAQWHYEQGLQLERQEICDYDAPENYYIAAKRGHLQAQKKLAECFEFGLLCLDIDLKSAAYWYRKAAEQGDAEAQYDVYEFYRNGKGVEKDLKEAIRWLEMAANGGYAFAMEVMGDCCLRGVGVPKRETEAFQWYQKAVEHGSVSAMQSLARCYEEGIGTKKNKLKANYYLHKYKKS